MEKMVFECIKSCNCNIMKLKRFQFYLDTETRKDLVKCYILSKIDCCNILYGNIPSTLLQKLGKVLKNAVRFVYGLRTRDHVSHYMKEAHILPVIYRIKYKACLFVYKTFKIFTTFRSRYSESSTDY